MAFLNIPSLDGRDIGRLKKFLYPPLPNRSAELTPKPSPTRGEGIKNSTMITRRGGV